MDDPLRDFAEGLAERKYNEAVEAWEQAMRDCTLGFERILRNPVRNLAEGLPPRLPDESIRALAHAKAIAAIGPAKPRRDVFYAHYGVG